MYSVLIVEDEMLVSIGLKNMIDWSKMDMKVIADAPNGLAALEIYNREKPDLILTDIKMPVMDGLELIAKIRETDNRTKIIILTCYQEFDLLYQALKMNVSDYILKLRMSTEDIESVIRKVHDELECENKNHIVDRLNGVDTQYYKEKLIKDYVIFKNGTASEFEEKLSKLHMRVKAPGLVLCLMKTYSRRPDNFSENQENSISDTILGMVDELFMKYERGEILYRGNGQYLLLFSFGEIASEKDFRALLNDMLERVRTIMDLYINADIVFGVSTRQNTYASLHTLFNEATVALKQGFFAGETRQILFGDNTTKQIYLSFLSEFRIFISDAHDLDSGYRKEILSGITLLENMFSMPEEELQEIIIRWTHWPAMNTSLYGDVASLAFEFAGQVRRCLTFVDSINVFRQYLVEITKFRSGVKMVGKEVAEAIEYIRANYASDITLQQVADKVEISANYLSSLFRKELDVSFTDYVNRIRIDKAKQMLLGSHTKIYEIAQRVGFFDESYFSRIFKRITGLRPLEYKRQNFTRIGECTGKDEIR